MSMVNMGSKCVLDIYVCIHTMWVCIYVVGCTTLYSMYRIAYMCRQKSTRAIPHNKARV